MEERIMNEQSRKLEAVRNRCRTSSRVVSVLQIVTIVGIVLALVGAIVCITQRGMIDEHVGKAVEAGSVTVENLRIGGSNINFLINYDRAFAAGNYALPIAMSCAVAAILCAIVTCALGLFKDIFKELSRETTPFSDRILGKLKYAFIMLTAALLVFVGIGPAVMGALLFWCIYSILEYGRALQSEVDEIL
jgi:hypothetical protein